MGRNFSDRFCQRYGVSPQRVSPALLWRTFRIPTLPLVPILRVMPFNVFRKDFEFLRSVGSCASMEDLIHVLKAMPEYYRESWEFRNRVGLRISGRRLLHLGRMLFEEA